MSEYTRAGVENLRSNKRSLELAIKTSIEFFERETGVTVTRVDVTRIDISTGDFEGSRLLAVGATIDV